MTKRGKTTHVLSEVNREEKTAYCGYCGNVKIYFNSKNGSPHCAEAAKIRVKEWRIKQRGEQEPIDGWLV